MEDKLFQTEEDINKALLDLRELEVNEGWLLVKRILEENMRVLEEELLDPENRENMGKKKLDMLSWRRHYMKRLIETPQTFIKLLEASEDGKVELDPYDKE